MKRISVLKASMYMHVRERKGENNQQNLENYFDSIFLYVIFVI